MKLPRRRFLYLAASAAALPAVARIALAQQAYPTRPVRLVVGFPAGQTADIAARLLAQWLTERLGQPFVIDNRPGASGTLATELVVHAPPDGYTLLFATSSNYINATLYEKLPYDFIRDIAPVAGNIASPLVLEVNPAVPVKAIPEFIAYAKANPGKLNMASAGNGNSTHVSGELFKMMTGINLQHVPYRGSAPAVTDLIAGQVQVMFDLVASSLAHIKAGKLRALAVTTRTRLDVLPDVPAVSEFVPGYEAIGVGGVGAPRGTPTEIIDKLNREINAGLADPKLKARLAELGQIVTTGSPADYGKFIAEETEKWGKVVKFAGIKPE
jgi:tripartite-type tricarboxylate transporter receptor subunit TctC